MLYLYNFLIKKFDNDDDDVSLEAGGAYRFGRTRRPQFLFI